MANKIIPEATDAPPITAAAFREMKERLYALENRQESTVSAQGANNIGLTATAQSLSEQVGELSARRILGEEAFYNQQVFVGTALPWVGPVLAATTFTVDKKRLVRLDLSAYISAFVQYTGGAVVHPTVAINNHFNWNGANPGYYSPWTQTLTATAGVSIAINMGQRISFFDLQVVNPGTYTVGYCPEITGLNGSTGYVRIQNPRILVQMLERAT